MKDKKPDKRAVEKINSDITMLLEGQKFKGKKYKNAAESSQSSLIRDRTGRRKQAPQAVLKEQKPVLMRESNHG